MPEILDGILTTRARVLRVIENMILEPPTTVTNIVGADGLTPTSPCHRIQGDGGAVVVTANPAIVPGVAGELLILEGASDVNTVRWNTGNGLHIHSPFVMAKGDILTLIYDATNSFWCEVTRNSPAFERSWAFACQDSAISIHYVGGFYKFGASDNDFNPSINFGTANSAYGAHFFIVAAAGGSGGTDTVIRVTGTSVLDSGARVTSDAEDLTADDAGAAGAYYETVKKWIGQISVEKISGPDLLCNYGFCKYWDNNNADFRLVGLETTWLGARNDNDPNVRLLHHKSSGWTYNNGSTPTTPTAIASMLDDYGTEHLIRSDEEGAWKRDNLTTAINGAGSEGTIIEITTTTNNTYAVGNFMLRIRPN